MSDGGTYFRLKKQSGGFTPPPGYVNLHVGENNHLYATDEEGVERDINGTPGPPGSAGADGHDGADGAGTTHANAAAFRAVASPTTSRARATLGGFHSEGDGGGGEFFWVSDSTDDDNAGLVIRPSDVASDAPGRWWRFYVHGRINPRWFGAIGDRSSHPLSAVNPTWTLADWQAVYPHATALTNEIDWLAIQAAINSVERPYPADPGVGVYLRGGDVELDQGIYECDQTINMTVGDRFAIVLRGVGTKGAPGSIVKGGGALIRYTGAGARFIDGRSGGNLLIEKLTLWYTNPAFDGILVDFSQGPSGSDTTACTLSFCALSADPLAGIAANTGAKALVSLWRAISSAIIDNEFGIAQDAIHGRRFLAGNQGYSNAITIARNTFAYHRRGIVNPGEQWNICNNTVEGLGGIMLNWITDDSPRTVIAAVRTFVFDPVAKTITASSGDFEAEGWRVGDLVTSFGYTLVNFGMLGPITSLTPTVMTLAGATFVNETTTACRLYSELPGNRISDASPGCIVTVDATAKTMTRSLGSWIDDNWQVGYALSLRGTSLNNGSTPPISAVTDTVISFATAGTLVDAVEDSGLAAGSFGAGPLTIRDNWMGDNFNPLTNWIELNCLYNAVELSGNICVGGSRCVQINESVGGLFVSPSNSLQSINGAIYINPLGSGSSGVVALAKTTSTAPMLSGAEPSSLISDDRFILRGQSFDMTGQFSLIKSEAAIDYSSMALLVSQAGLGVGLGADATSAYLQSGGKLRIQWFTGDTILNGFGNGRVQVGYPYNGAPADPASLLQVNGAIATTIRELPTNADTTVGAFDSAFKVNASEGDAAGVMPDPSTCKGREYVGIASDVSGGVASVKTAAGLIKGVGLSAVAYPFASQWESARFKSDGTNWIVVGKVA